MSTKQLLKARRSVERMRLAADGATDSQLEIWDAEQTVVDLEAAERDSAVRTARTAGRAMDAVLLVVALLTMAFSMQNIHDFAAHHAVQDPIAWFVAPAVDLALIAALLGDAVLSRWQLDAGDWATRLRWYTGAATVTLNSWEAWAELDPAAIVLHTAMPVLLFVLAEAASPYRHQFAETVKRAMETAEAKATLAVLQAAPLDDPVSTPAPAEVDTATEPTPAAPAGEVYDQETDSRMSTQSPQETAPAATWESETRKAVDWVFNGGADSPMPTRTVDASNKPLPTADTTTGRLDAAAARKEIEDAWTAGLTIREAAPRATRSTSYVQGVYAQLTKQRGPQPSKGQMGIEDAA